MSPQNALNAGCPLVIYIGQPCCATGVPVPSLAHPNCSMFPVRLPCKSCSGILPGTRHFEFCSKSQPCQQAPNHVYVSDPNKQLLDLTLCCPAATDLDADALGQLIQKFFITSSM